MCFGAVRLALEKVRNFKEKNFVQALNFFLLILEGSKHLLSQ